VNASDLVAIHKAHLVGTCGTCGEPTTGIYDSDEHEEMEEPFIMTCVNCKTRWRVVIFDCCISVRGTKVEENL